MRLSELTSGTGVSLAGRNVELPIKINVDSRTVRKGEGFVALRGSRTDGHRFIEDVLKKGASCVICEEAEYNGEWRKDYPMCTFVLTPDRCEYAIARLARAYADSIPDLKEIMAVTGSVGKTSTKNYASVIMSGKYRVHTAAGNYNTLIGCSVTVLGAPTDTQILLLEMGANHKGEIAEMVSYLPPDVAAVTEVAPAHLEHFGTLDGVLSAKSEIFASERLKTAVINGDNLMLVTKAEELGLKSVVKFGRRGNVSFEGERLRWKDHGFEVNAIITGLDGMSFKVSLPISGVHQLYPVACACALAGLAGMSSHEIASELPKCRSAAGRGQIKISGTGAAILDECYNASPAAVLASLTSMSIPDILGRRIMVLGEMLELGEASEFQHGLVFSQARRISEHIFLYGDAWKKVPGACKYCRDSLSDIIDEIDAMDLGDGDVVLVKGSRSNHLERVVRALEV